MAGSDAIFEVRDLAKSFPVRAGSLRRITGWLRAVDHVNMRIARNSILGLVGESGSGKTTFGRLLVKLLDPTSGQILFDGKDVGRLHGAERRWFRKNVQMLFQDPFLSLNPYKTVFQTLSYPLRIHRLAEGRHLKARVEQLLAQVGLEAAVARAYPHELSGGQRQRISLAAALAVEPQFIFCDEPVSALDMSARAQVLNLLQEVQRDRNLTLLIVSHDLSAVEYVCHDVAVMYLGGVVELANKDRLFADPAHPYTEALMSAVPEPDPDLQATRREIVLEGEIPSPANPPDGCKFHTRCPRKIGAICEADVPALRPVGQGHEVSCHLYPPASHRAAPGTSGIEQTAGDSAREGVSAHIGIRTGRAR